MIPIKDKYKNSVRTRLKIGSHPDLTFEMWSTFYVVIYFHVVICKKKLHFFPFII